MHSSFRSPRWTAHETLVLMNNPHATDAEIGRMLGRLERSVRAKRRALGYSSVPQPRPMLPRTVRPRHDTPPEQRALTARTYRPWTRQDERFILENYAKFSISELAAILERSYYSVATKIRILGIRKPAEYAHVG